MYTVEQKVAKMQGLDKLSLWTKINNRFEKFFLVDIFGWSKIFEKCKKANMSSRLFQNGNLKFV